MGQEEPFPRRRLSGRCGFRKQSLAVATSERIDRFAGGLTFCFFPAAPVFWLIGHFEFVKKSAGLSDRVGDKIG
jgi:hypothetical protein